METLPPEHPRNYEEMRMYGFDPRNPKDCAEWDGITDTLPAGDTPSDYSQDQFEFGSPGQQG